MKNRRIVTIVLYVAVLALAFSWMLGVFGGGNNGLPDGYLQAYFLESTGTQYVMTGFFPDDTSSIDLDVNPVHAPGDLSIWLFANADADRNEEGRAFKAASSGRKLYYEFGSLHSTSTEVHNPPEPAFGIRRKLVLQNGLCYTGLAPYEFHKQTFKNRLVELSLFRNLRDTTVTTLDIYSCRLTKNSKAERDFVPVLDASGTPCMYDLVSKQPFRNEGSGQFIVGFTRAQARKLGKLAPGSSFTVSLPVGWQQDAGVVEALAQAEANGCVLPVHEYTEGESAAATYALRRIWVKRTPDALGGYVDTDGARWQVEWCVDVVGADPVELGFERFRSVEAARDFWGLVDYVYPEAEQPENELATIEAE